MICRLIYSDSGLLLVVELGVQQVWQNLPSYRAALNLNSSSPDQHWQYPKVEPTSNEILVSTRIIWRRSNFFRRILVTKMHVLGWHPSRSQPKPGLLSQRRSCFGGGFAAMRCTDFGSLAEAWGGPGCIALSLS